MGDGDFVWTGDDDDSGDDETEPGVEGDSRQTEDADVSSPFSDLVDRVDDSTSRPVDVDALADSLSPEEPAAGREDLARLLERVTDRGAREPSGSPPSEPGEGGRAAPDDVTDVLPETPGGGPGSGDSRSSDASDPSTLEDLFDAGSGGTDDPSGPAAGDDPSPFDDLADRVDGAVADRARGGQPTPRGRGHVTTTDPDALPADASGILVLDDPDGPDDYLTCQSLIARSRPERTNLLLVWLSRDLTDRLERVYETYAGPSTNVTVVCRSKVGESFHADPSIPTDSPGGRLSIHRISDPRDLPKLGIAISQIVSDWQGHPNQTVMCFDSITNLLQFAEFERVFRFLHVLQGRIDSIDARAHYHLDRDAHDERTLTMFWNLFDATVDATADGYDGGA